jgi:D-aspartate ligase
MSSTVAPNPDRVYQARHNWPGAVVIGANYRALGVVRSLGRHGIPVWVLRQEDELLATLSRYTLHNLAWPAGDDSKGIDFLIELGAKYGLKGWLLFPTGDENTALVARHHEWLGEQFQLTTLPWNVLCWVHDKRLLYRLAQRLAIDYPWTFCPHTCADLTALDCPFPVILKPAMKTGFNRFIAAKAWQVNDRRSLLARYKEACGLVAPDLIMVQEVIPGGGETQFSYAALFQDGRSLASVVARRTRQYPMDFGRASTFVETVAAPGVVEPAVRLLAMLRFTGLVEVEFKYDLRDGRYKLLDVNPRIWGWISLCERAGVDFPYLLWLLMRGDPVPEVRGAIGVKWMRMSTDLPIAVQEMLRGRLSLLTYARSFRGPHESAIFAPDDPLPGVLELPLMAYVIGRRWARGSGI